MTWEETIEYIRNKEEYADLVKKAYFERDLLINVKRFSEGEEFKATMDLIELFAPKAHSILDIGAGNGISSVAFAKAGFEVHAVEPDPSTSIGSGAIVSLKNQLKLENLEVHQSYAENLEFEEGMFDVVYARQAMHHANDLPSFVRQCSKALKTGGLLLTVRDHVIYDDEDKIRFLKNHPLHKYYGGENAYKVEEYQSAMRRAGLQIVKEFGHFDTVINYFPLKTEIYKQLKRTQKVAQVFKKLGLYHLNALRPFTKRFTYSLNFDNETNVSGRHRAFLAIKK